MIDRMITFGVGVLGVALWLALSGMLLPWPSL